MVAVAILIVTHLSQNISLKIIIRRNFTAVSTISLMGNFCISYKRPEWRGSQLPLPRSKMGDGNGIDEHMRRFQPGDRYYPLLAMNQMVDFVLLNFTQESVNALVCFLGSLFLDHDV